MTFERGQAIDVGARRFVVEGPLATGGFGVTWAGHDEYSGQAVVLKALRLDRLDDWKAVELFEREARVLRQLDHPGIPRYFASFSWDGERALPAGTVPEAPAAPPSLVLVQERVPGRTLAEAIEAGAHFTAAALEALLRGVLQTLDYLHGLHPPVIHRDISPRNLVLGRDDAPHLIDFGAIQDSLRSATRLGSTEVGSFGYTPMEQMMGRAGPASDLYALGMCLVVAATRLSPTELPIDDHSGKIALDRLDLRLPAPLRSALSGMIEPIAGRRLPSVGAVRDVLDGRAPVDPEPGLPAPVPRSRRGLYNVSMALGLIAAGLTYITFFDDLSETVLVQISPLWAGPIAFGALGRIFEAGGSPHALSRALLGAGVFVAGLVFFFFAIFPSL